ncbi:MAG: hypothetical protein P9L90_05835 [Candidatus Aadella gelida]|nr:hypothetical protein [Candidatus Aadella gelida]
MSAPQWLPDKVDYYNDFGSNWTSFVNHLYEIFKTDIRDNSNFTFEGKKILYDKAFGQNSKENGFWHLVTRKDDKTGQRDPDFLRAEKLPWGRPIIENCSDLEVLNWKNKRGSKIKIYLWLKNFDYVVILKEHKRDCVLLTAYHIDQLYMVRQLNRKYSKRI